MTVLLPTLPRAGRRLIAVCAMSLVACGTNSPPSTPPMGQHGVALTAQWQSPVPWQTAAPADHLDKGRWWSVFDDEVLAALIEQAHDRNASLAVMRARLRQSQANAALARAGQWPKVDATARSQRQGTSANRPGASYNAAPSATVQNDLVLSANVSYELDLFDRIGQEVQASEAAARQAGADLANARMVLAADLVSTYYSLRQVDAEISALQQSITLQSRAVSLLRARQEGGSASGLDVAQQQAQLDSTQTQLALLQRQRPLLVHGLAVLSGQSPSLFNLAPWPTWNASAVSIPVSQPSEVLQRRPDVAAAQYAVSAAQAQAGAVRHAAFPSILLGGSSGLESRRLSTLLDAPSLLWSVGLSVTQNLWDGGRQHARQDAAHAVLDAAAASYQQVVLRAIQEVEDGLSSVQALATATQSAEAARVSASKALDIAQARQAGGLATYLDVITAQQSLLNSERQWVQIQAQQRIVSAYLVKALGGGWTSQTHSSATPPVLTFQHPTPALASDTTHAPLASP